MIKDRIEDDPNYGKMIDLWIFAPVKKEWIQIQDSTFLCSVLFDANDSSFIRSLHWLNIGAMFFEHGIDPNKAQFLAPICFPEEFRKKHGIMQDNLHEATLKGNLKVMEFSASFRDVVGEAVIARKQRALEVAKKNLEASKPKIVTTDQIIELLKQDWQDINLVTEMRLKIISMKHKIIRQGDKVRIEL